MFLKQTKATLELEESEEEGAEGLQDGIESFWSFAKRRLAKFNGLTDDKFFLHLKECEFRLNHRNENLEQKALKIMKKSAIC